MTDREVTMRISLKSDDFRKSMEDAATGAGEVAKAIQREQDRRLGELTREAFAGAWRVDVEAFDMCADVERYTEVSRLLTLAVKLAAQGNWSDAIDSARSAAATCPEVPALAADVGRIIAILEAP